METDKSSIDGFGYSKADMPTASIENLSHIATEIECYLSQWVSRLEEVMDHYGKAPEGEASLQRRVEQFEAEQRRWHQQRQQEAEQIQDTMQQLTDAWERLEDQQRQLLQTREKLQTRAGDAAPIAAADSRSERPAGSRTHRGGAGCSTGPAPADAAPLSHEDAVRQFQQLKRQMGLHTP